MAFSSRPPRCTETLAGIEETAADWVCRHRGGLSVEELARLRRWLEADPRHAEAFARLESAWRLLDEPRARGRSSDLVRVLGMLEHGRRRRRIAAVVCGAGLAAVLAVGLFLSSPAPVSTPSLSPTVALRPDRQVLPDGSVVEFNAGAEIEVSYTPGKRIVHLRRGEALFQVAKNKARPFVVVAGQLEVTAVGTAFSVRNVGSEVGVLVTEGKVSVERPLAAVAAPSPEAIYLAAGDRVVVPSHALGGSLPQPEKVAPADLKQALAWRGMRVEFTGTPLSDAVELFNRQNSLQLEIGDDSLAELQLTGIFWADDPEGFVRLLETGMNVRAERDGNTISLRRR
jgi:transmembrane sensor